MQAPYNESSKSNVQFGMTSHIRTTRMISKGYTRVPAIHYYSFV